MRQSLSAALLLVFIPATTEAEPGSRTCRQLEARLAALPSGNRAAASPAQVKRYDSAIARQQEQMATARAQARQAGCGFAIMGRSLALCGELNATLTRMKSNLAKLQKQRAQLGAGSNSNSKRDRANILTALDANDCRQPRKPPARNAKASVKTKPGPKGTVPQSTRPRSISGKLRTMCVRSCDGYYFPISWSVSQAVFERDGRVCQAMCPGTKVELYYHRTAGEEPEDMVSATTGLPYRDSETAFLYKQPGSLVPAGCGCGATAQASSSFGGFGGFETIGGNYENNTPGASAPMPADDTAVTSAFPVPGEKPDHINASGTLLTREGGFDATILRRLATPLPSRTGEAREQRQIRVVGPMFLPDQ